MRLRSTGITKAQVAKKLHTTRENITIIEHRTHENLRAAKATLAAIDELSGSNEVIIPSGVSIFEATSMILRRANVLRIKVKKMLTRFLLNYELSAGEEFGGIIL
jgi:Tfx family DNA-binding protein